MWVPRKEFESLKFRIEALENEVNGRRATINSLINDYEICTWEPVYTEEKGWVSLSYQQKYKIGDIVKKILEHLNLKIEKYPECIGLVKLPKK